MQIDFNKNWFTYVPLIGIGLILIGWFATGGATAGKTYTTPSAALTFKYGGAWQLASFQEQDYFLQLDKPGVELFVREEALKRVLPGAPPSLHLTITGYNESAYAGYQELTKDTMEINGQQAIAINYSFTHRAEANEETYRGRDVAFPLNGMVYILSMTGPPAAFEASLPSFQAIAKSVQLDESKAQAPQASPPAASASEALQAQPDETTDEQPTDEPN